MNYYKDDIVVGHMDCYHFYRPQRSCGQGYVFTRVCDSVHGGGLRRTPPGPGRHHPPGTRQTPPPPPGTRQTPPLPGPGRHPWQGEPPWTKENPPDQADTPPAGRTPRTKKNPSPPDQADTPTPGPRRTPREEDCSIRSISGRYASYWNAFLFH